MCLLFTLVNTIQVIIRGFVYYLTLFFIVFIVLIIFYIRVCVCGFKSSLLQSFLSRLLERIHFHAVISTTRFFSLSLSRLQSEKTRIVCLSGCKSTNQRVFESLFFFVFIFFLLVIESSFILILFLNVKVVRLCSIWDDD